MSVGTEGATDASIKQRLYNIEQALARIAHATGTSQFADMYGIKKEAK